MLNQKCRIESPEFHLDEFTLTWKNGSYRAYTFDRQCLAWGDLHRRASTGECNFPSQLVAAVSRKIETCKNDLRPSNQVAFSESI